MIEKLKTKIKELQIEKNSLRRDFSEDELHLYLDNYIRLKKIDGALEVLREMLVEEMKQV